MNETRTALTPQERDALLESLVPDPACPPGHPTREELAAYATDALDEGERPRLDAHVAGCIVCTAELAKLLEELERIDATPSVPEPTVRARLTRDVLALLQETKAIERGWDYCLPSKLHTDTHLNMAKVCGSEDAMVRLAAAFDLLLSDVTVDAIVATGWAMGQIARRLVRLRTTSARPRLRTITVEGYEAPLFVSQIPTAGYVVILTDVVITGRLTTLLTKTIEHAGARVVAVATVARPKSVRAVAGVRSLCRLQMEMAPPEKCRLCGRLESMEFNPFSYRMTRKKATPRSAEQFLAETSEAAELWELVAAADAYRHHCVERGIHYLRFIDTTALLTNPKTGPRVMERLAEIRNELGWAPDFVVIPRKQRARLMGALLLERFREAGKQVELVVATNRGSEVRLSKANRKRLRGAQVLLADTAAGHGDSLDRLITTAQSAGAADVAAVVMISRLPDLCEKAFRQRLAGRFRCLYHVPIRPIAVRAGDRGICPACSIKVDLRAAADASRSPLIQNLARFICGQHPAADSGETVRDCAPTEKVSGDLFASPNAGLLERCEERLASGIVQHALHAAINDGMAPLSLPEIDRPELPIRTRATILRDLPKGVIAWSGPDLRASLRNFLAVHPPDAAWLEAANLFTREGCDDWVGVLEQWGDTRPSTLLYPRVSFFWHWLAFDAYTLAARSPDTRGQLVERLERMAEKYGCTKAGEPLRQMVDAARAAGETSGAKTAAHQ